LSYKLTISEKPAYLHAIVTGENSRETVVQYLKDIVNECKTRNYDLLLIEERLEGPRLGALDVFQIASAGSKPAHGVYKAIAYVDVNAEGDQMKFAETVALNRALPVRVFATVAEAEIWLLDKVGD